MKKNLSSSSPSSSSSKAKPVGLESIGKWLSSSSRPIDLVVGDGEIALWKILFALSKQDESRRVLWVAGKGAQILPVLPSFPAHPSFVRWLESFGDQFGRMQSGHFLREFRNKAFRDPSWVRSGDSPQKHLWEPEVRFLIRDELRLDLTPLDFERWLRETVLAEQGPNLFRLEGVPVDEVVPRAKLRVRLGTGENIEVDRLIWADSWNELRRVEGLSRLTAPTLRGRDPMGVLQIQLKHRVPMGVQEGRILNEGVLIGLHRESGESFDRNLWGYFADQGRKSLWTVALTSEESENNHEIAKKLRRAKAALEKVFGVAPWLPSGMTTFAETVEFEKVRVLEKVLYQGGTVPASPLTFGVLPGFELLTEGYGLESAFEQIFEGQETEFERAPVSEPHASLTSRMQSDETLDEIRSV